MRSPNAILYSSATYDGTLNNGSWLIGVDENVEYGPTSQTGFYAGYPSSRYGYYVYKNKVSGGPSIRLAETEEELIQVLIECGATGSTLSEVMSWSVTQPDILITNATYPKVITEGLQVYYDAGYLLSYPKTGSIIYDASNNTNNGTLINSPKFNRDKHGQIILNGVDQRIQFGSGITISDSSDWTIEMAFSSNETTTGSTYFRLLGSTSNSGLYPFLMFTDYQTLSGNNNTNTTFISTTNISKKNWLNKDANYLAIVGYSGGTFDLYVNGELCSSSNSGFTGTATFNLLGFSNGNYNPGGKLLLFRYYNRALTNEEITTTYQESKYRYGGSNVPIRRLSNNFTNSVGYIDGFGQAWTVGFGSLGILGNNDTTNKCRYITVYGNHTFCQINVGGSFMSALDLNGQAWGWGSGSLGRLGDDNTVTRLTPVAVCGNHTFCMVSCGANHTLGLDISGKLWSWGYNDRGMLGDNTTLSRITPVAVCGNHTFCYIFTAQESSYGIDINNQLWGWGSNNTGMLGDNTVISRSTPVAVCGGHSFTYGLIGRGNSVGAIDINGNLWMWGSNINGSLGDNTTTARSTPIAVCGGHTFRSGGIGNSAACAIDNTGSTWCWGNATSFGLGNTNIIGSSRTPVRVYGDKTFCELSMNFGRNFVSSIDNEGVEFSWGDMGLMLPAIGEFPKICSLTPELNSKIERHRCIAGGNRNGFLISRDDKLYSWGDNTYGQCGYGDISSESRILASWTPKQVYGDRKYSIISSGFDDTSSCAIDSSGQTWCWGINNRGQLGNGSVVSSRTPVAVCGGHTFCKVVSGTEFKLGLDVNGVAWGWGMGFNGRLGNNSILCQCTPVAVYGNHTFIDITSGLLGGYGIDHTGKLWSWGGNQLGQLGDDTVVSKSTPVAVCGNHTFCLVSGGNNHCCGIDTSGVTWCWGINSNGGLGDNTITSRRTPVAVCGNHTFSKIFCGNNFTLAIDISGQTWAWGFNSSGQLATNSQTSRRTPFAICGNHTFTRITIINGNVHGVDISGDTWSWGGGNIYGERGEGYPFFETPTKICDYFI